MDHQLIQLTHPVPSSSAKPAMQSSNDARLCMCSSLCLALYKGQMEEAMALLEHQHGAAADQATGIQHGQCDVLEVSAERNTVLHVAAQQGHDELVRELCVRFKHEAKGLLSSRNSALDTPLHCAARARRDTVVSLLIQLAQDCGERILGCKNEDGDTALHLAARHGHAAAVEALVSAAPELASELNDAGVSPLYFAVMSRSVPAVRAITTRCTDASSVGPSSQNALHAAVLQSPDMVDLLLQWKPALASKVDVNSSSPLHFASSDGDLSIVRAILRSTPPSTVYMQDSDRLSAQGRIQRGPSEGTGRHSIRRSSGILGFVGVPPLRFYPGSAPVSALHVAALMGHDGVIKELIKACPDAAELRDGHGRTFLHAAAKEGRSSVVQRAVENPMLDGLVDAQDRDGNTPLHLAVVAGQPSVAHALTRSGKVRADVMNKDGDTPFDLAAKLTSFSSMVSLVVILTAYGVQSRPQRQDHLKQWSGRDIARWIENTYDSLAVVAGLIATVAFSAAFNVPGGYGDNGLANLQGEASYVFFIILDSVALTASVVAVMLLVYGKASGSSKSFIWSLHCLWVSLISMVTAFWASSVAVTSRGSISSTIYLVTYTGVYVLAVGVVHWIKPVPSWITIGKFLCCSFLPGRRRRRITRQYPFAGTYSRNLCIFIAINISAYIGVLLAVRYI